MNPKYELTQNAIKQCIAKYIEDSPESSQTISVDELGRSKDYLNKSMESDRVLGIIALTCITKAVPIPTSLLDRAAVEHAERLVKRGQRIKRAHHGFPWRQTVEQFRKERPILYRPWIASA